MNQLALSLINLAAFTPPHFSLLLGFHSGYPLMTQATAPSYNELNQVLTDNQVEINPSEIHGMICGILSGNNKKSIPWEEYVAGAKNPKKIHEILQALLEATQKQLDEFLFELELLLPPDNDSLALRAESLTLWTQGYLTGLKLADVPLRKRKPSDVTEAINDLIEISKMNYDTVAANEEDETAYVELVEYIRMAVIMIYEELHEQEKVNKSVH